MDGTRGRVDSLLMTLVHRPPIDALRMRQRRESISDVMPHDAEDQNAAELFDEVADALTHERVIECMESLPDDYRSWQSNWHILAGSHIRRYRTRRVHRLEPSKAG